MAIVTVSPAQLQEMLKSETQLAFLDVREQGVYAQGHPLYAISLPLSQLELEVERLVPQKKIPLYLLDQGATEDLAAKAAEILQAMGYSNLHIVIDGVSGWQEAGLEIFSGVNVPSKAFGEFVEAENQTPHISATELQEKLSGDENVIVLDSRPFDEFNRMCIPGGIDVPGAELMHRVFDAVPDETTTIIVNCAGRTRSIIGAQSLRNAGINNPVMALKDGTMGWYLAGNELERNADRIAESPSEAGLAKAKSAAMKVAAQAGVVEIKASELISFQQQPDISLFILDVRTEDEFLAGHLRGSQHSPGGQLVQATDEYVGIRNSKLVLVDDQGVRAWMSASWLRQMGWHDVSVLTDFTSLTLETGAVPAKEVAQSSVITALELDAVLSSGEPVALVDLSNSLAYREKHIPGAYWAIRSRLEQDMSFLPPVGFIILTAEDERLAHLTAKEVARLKPQLIVRVLKGGNQAWYDAGLKVETGEGHFLSQQDDLWYKPYDNKEKVKERMQEYLDWEVALVGQVARDGVARFQTLKS